MSSVPSSSRPVSPKKPGSAISDKPNPHPYAVKTTSTGVLSRSTTTPISVSHSHNRYVPVSPSPSPTKSTGSGFSERESRHRYSRSLTEDVPRPLPVEPHHQQQRKHEQTRSGGETMFFEDQIPDDNPRTWTSEQLAANVPEISDFVLENDITGRAFLRFDEGVLDAYGVVQQRSLILSTSRKLRQSMLKDRIWPQQSGGEYEAINGRNSRSASPTKQTYSAIPNDEDDQAYLSSSSSISSTSSISGRKKRMYKRNGRVHGMVASLEISSSQDGPMSRDRAGSVNSVLSSSERNPTSPYDAENGNMRPLPLPPQLTGEFSTNPLLLPSSTSQPSLFNTAQATRADKSIKQSLQFTGNGRPLPSIPTHPSLRDPPVFGDEDEGGRDDAVKNNSGEMTMDELIATLNADVTADEREVVDVPAEASVHNPYTEFESRKKQRKPIEGAAAWEKEYTVGDTVKRAPPEPATSTTVSIFQDEDLSVEELLLQEDAASKRDGAAAWVNESKESGWTVKHIETFDKVTDQARFGSSRKSKSIEEKVEGKFMSAEKMKQPQGQHGRRLEEVFDVREDFDENKDKQEEEFEIERMREAERKLLRAEEEERERWIQSPTEVVRPQNDFSEAATGLLSERALEEEPQHTERTSEQEVDSREEDDAEKRRQLEREQQLMVSITQNKELLDAFHKRLEEVERRVEEMEFLFAARVETTSNRSQTDGPVTFVVSHFRVLAAWALSAPVSSVLPALVKDSLAGFVRAGNNASNRYRNISRALEGYDSNTIPKHILLIGIGMCAVVLRGLMRCGVSVRGVGVLGARQLRQR